jgi:hypothetical protein
MTTTPMPSKPDRVLGGPSLAPMLTDWWRELLWPRVLTAARLGIRPERLGLGFFAVVLGAVLIEIGLTVDAQLVPAGPVWPWMKPSSAEANLATLWLTYVSVPKALVLGLPITTLIIGPVLLTCWLVMLGAVSRMTACEVSLGEPLSWTDGLRFALEHWKSLLGAILGPLVIVWVIAGVLVLAGLLARWPVTNVIFALVYGVALAAAFLAVMVLVLYILGHNMLIPAVVCEGTDAIDAIQKAYRYAMARPLLLVFYLVLGAIGWLIVVGVVWLIVSWTIGFAARATGTWGGEGYWMIWRPTLDTAAGLGFPAGNLRPAQGAMFSVGASIIRIWVLIPAMLVFAAAVSCGIAVHTVIYLVMRRVCDGQDIAELWIPGMIAGTMKVSLEGRGQVVAESQPPPAPTGNLEQADYQ